MSHPPDDGRRAALINSLRQRFAKAEARGDAATKQALFQEAAALNLPPELWHGQSANATEPISKAPD
ncbi:MAG: hypothetical protein WCF98_01045 [Synechococcus sp. ELA057]